MYRSSSKTSECQVFRSFHMLTVCTEHLREGIAVALLPCSSCALCIVYTYERNEHRFGCNRLLCLVETVVEAQCMTQRVHLGVLVAYVATCITSSDI
jgi:hypothetical protein